MTVTAAPKFRATANAIKLTELPTGQLDSRAGRSTDCGSSDRREQWLLKPMGVTDNGCNPLSAVPIFKRHLHGACQSVPWPVSLAWAAASFGCPS
jgi:hypothetical protein